MLVDQWHTEQDAEFSRKENHDLVLFFGHPESVSEQFATALQSQYPGAEVVGCSAWGHFLGDQAFTEGCGVTAIQLESGSVVAESIALSDPDRPAAALIAEKLSAHGEPQGVLILWNELHGSAEHFVLGLRKRLSSECLIFGGLASDDLSFERIAVYSGSEEVAGVAVGIYGDELGLTSGCRSGFASHGRIHHVTQAEGRTVIEIDDRPALDVLCEHLGPEAENLPHSAMHFPLQLLTESGDRGLLRGLVAVDRENKTFTCAGIVPEGAVRLLTFTEPEDLFDGARLAAEEAVKDVDPGLALVVSCTGRRSLFGPTSDIELEHVSDALGPDIPCTGFYAGGEIAPLTSTRQCELHNQTIAVTGLCQRESLAN